MIFAPGVQSKKRGLSIDEKKQKVLEIFHESKDVLVLKVCLDSLLLAIGPGAVYCLVPSANAWSLQDIEKLAPKKGVVLQSVKEVVQGLVDDDLGEHMIRPGVHIVSLILQ